MPFVYLDVDGVVIAKSLESRVLAGVQAVNPAVVESVSVTQDLWGQLFPKSSSSTSLYYHQRTANDGTSLEDYESFEHLDPVKIRKRWEINNRTEEIIAGGFTYNNILFALDVHDQINWIGLYVFKDLMTYPMTLKGKEEDSYYTVNNAQEVMAFAASGMAHVNGALQSGFALKQAVDAATSFAELNTIVDNR